MADRLISINTELPPGSQLPVAVREELAQYSALNPTSEVTGAYTATVNDMVLVAASAATTVTLPSDADGTRVVGVHIVSGESAVTLQTSGVDTLIAPDNGITSLALAGPEVNVGLSVWRYDAAGACWHPISLTALPAVDDLVDASMLGRSMLTATTAAEIRSLLGAVAAEDVADLFGTSWEPPVYDAKAATGYTAYASVTSGTKTLSGFSTTAGAFEVVAVFGYRSAGASMAFTVTSGGTEMIPASDVVMGGGVGPTSGNASFAQLFINPDASGSAHDIIVSWESSASCSPNISVGAMSFTGVSTYGAADVKTGSESGTSISHTVSSAPERVVANLMWHEPLTGTGIISYSGLQGQAVPAGSYGQATQGYAAGGSAVTFTGTRASGADYGSIAVQLTGSVTYENAAVLLEDTTAFTQDLLTAGDAAAARAKLSAAELVGGKLPVSQLPTSAMEYKGVWDASANTPTLANGSGDAGDTYRVSVGGARDLGGGSVTYGVGDLVLYDGSVWQRSDSVDAVESVAGKTGVVTLDKGDVGLGNVDNTSDADKPVSTAVQTALDAKAVIMTGTCATAAGTTAKTVTLDAPWASRTPAAGDWMLITFTGGQSATDPTLAVNADSARVIGSATGATGAAVSAANGGALLLWFNGSAYQVVAPQGVDVEIAQADLTNASGTVTGLISGRRAEALMANEATKTRTLASKTLTAPVFAGVTKDPTFGADLTPAGGLGDAGWTKAGGTSWSAPDLTVPSGGTVSCSVAVTSGKMYRVDMVRTAQSGGDLTVSIGAATTTGAYWLTGLTVTAAASGSLTLTVGGGTWAGTVQNITCKEVTAFPSQVADLGGHPVRTPGILNVGVGKDSLKQVTHLGAAATALGYEALMQTTDGQSNTAVGYRVLRALTTGVGNTAVGANALRVNTTGSSNVSIGDGVHTNLASGSYNTAVGAYAQNNRTGGNNDTAVGYGAQYTAATSLGKNTAVGGNSQYNNTGGSNVSVGYDSQRGAVSSNYNVAVGTTAQYGGVSTGGGNVAIGGSAQYGAVTGANNIAVGQNTQYAALSGSGNIAVGASAQYAVTSGINNIAVGASAQYSITTGANNIGIGIYAAQQPNGNAAWATTTAQRQVCIGRDSGQGSATQSDDIVCVGYRALGDGAKATAIGTQANCGHAGSVALGSDTATTATAQVAIGQRDLEIQDAAKGVVLKSPDGSRWRITINNAGTIAGTKL